MDQVTSLQKNVSPLSEKLDGVRAYWDGTRFISRLGNPFSSPTWFTQDLPTTEQLDGEIFGQRGDFNTTISIVRRLEGNLDPQINTQTGPAPAGVDPARTWNAVKFQIFDIPSQKVHIPLPIFLACSACPFPAHQ